MMLIRVLSLTLLGAGFVAGAGERALGDVASVVQLRDRLGTVAHDQGVQPRHFRRLRKRHHRRAGWCTVVH